jgi:hypothetical protein
MNSRGAQEYYCARYTFDPVSQMMLISLNVNPRAELVCDTSKDADYSNDEVGNKFLALQLSPGEIQNTCTSIMLITTLNISLHDVISIPTNAR